MPIIIQAELTKDQQPASPTALLTTRQIFQLQDNQNILLWPGTPEALTELGDPEPHRQDHPPEPYIAAALLEKRLAYPQAHRSRTFPIAVRLRLHPHSPIHEFLTKAKSIIENPTRWTQRALARDKSGVRVNLDEDTAVKWCMNGACWKAAEDAANSYHTALRMISLLTDAVTPYATTSWQDQPNRKHGEVTAVFDKTIRASTPHNAVQGESQ